MADDEIAAVENLPITTAAQVKDALGSRWPSDQYVVNLANLQRFLVAGERLASTIEALSDPPACGQRNGSAPQTASRPSEGDPK